MRRVLAALTITVLLVAIVIERVVAYKIQQITHPPQHGNFNMKAANDQPITQIALHTADGLSLVGWHIPSQNNATIILQHGYSDNSSQLINIGLVLAEQGYGVLFFDFRGHGKSESATVTLGLDETQDTDAAVAFLKQQTKSDNHKIGLLGNSMGGATAIIAAANNLNIDAVAVEGVFAELKEEVGIGITTQTPLPAKPFDSIFMFLTEWKTGLAISDVAPVEEIGAISPRPILIMQGGKDVRIEADSGERLFAAAGEPKEYWYEDSAEHVTFQTTVPVEYERRIVDFFDTYLK